METLVENRTRNRVNISWPVSVWIPAANRFFNGKISNISKTGVFMNVPILTPVRQGQVIEMNFPRTEALADQKGGFARIKQGKVVRVERRNMLKTAGIGVAVAFESDTDSNTDS